MDLREIRRRRNAYVRARLLEQEKEEPRGFQAKLVKILGMSSAHVSNYLKGKSGDAGEVGERLAFALWRIDTRELDDLAKDIQLEAEAAPDSSPRPAESKWRDLANRDAQFYRLAEARLAHAHTDEERRLVEGALNMAALNMPLHYGGRKEPLTWDEAKELYREAWADLHDDPTIKPAATPVAAPQPTPSIKELAERAKAESAAERAAKRKAT